MSLKFDTKSYKRARYASQDKTSNEVPYPVFFHINWNRKFIIQEDTIYLLDFDTHMTGTLSVTLNSAKDEILQGHGVRLFGLWVSANMITKEFTYY